jgi:hypothetical protein
MTLQPLQASRAVMASEQAFFRSPLFEPKPMKAMLCILSGFKYEKYEV